jgi:chorismate dehydratase
MNVVPVYYGLDHGLKPGWLEMECHPPADLNRMISQGRLDISPVSSVAYAHHQDEWLILPDLSISCLGKVMSVLLVSHYPIKQLSGKTIIMTRESATSTELLRLLCTMKKVSPIFTSGTVKTAAELPEETAAALVIGDSALNGQWESRFEHIVDLGQMWHQLTGLPFVFALWVVRRKVAEQYPKNVAAVVDLLQQSRRMGQHYIEQVARNASATLGLDMEQCREYYKILQYVLDKPRQQGLQTFFDGLWQQDQVNCKIRLNFFQHIHLSSESLSKPSFISKYRHTSGRQNTGLPCDFK